MLTDLVIKPDSQVNRSHSTRIRKGSFIPVASLQAKKTRSTFLYYFSFSSPLVFFPSLSLFFLSMKLNFVGILMAIFPLETLLHNPGKVLLEAFLQFRERCLENRDSVGKSEIRISEAVLSISRVCVCSYQKERKVL